jgi:hypothetical protein
MIPVTASSQTSQEPTVIVRSLFLWGSKCDFSRTGAITGVEGLRLAHGRGSRPHHHSRTPSWPRGGVTLASCLYCGQAFLKFFTFVLTQGATGSAAAGAIITVSASLSGTAARPT